MLALGCMAQRLGGELEFDREKKQFKNSENANHTFYFSDGNEGKQHGRQQVSERAKS